MTETIDRRVRLRSTANFRDMGGLPVDGGAFARGQVFRSAALADLADDERELVDELGIGVVYDLRTRDEALAKPDRLPTAARLVGLDVMADGNTNLAAAFGKLATDPSELGEVLSSGRFRELLGDTYRDFVVLPSAIASYRELFRGIADPERGGAALFHCAVGKDRTGWAAASLLMLLGADEATIHSDYLQTNDDLLPSLEPMIVEVASRGGLDPELLRDAFGVDLGYLDAALDELDSRFGSAERYFSDGLGLDAATIDALRTRLVA